MNRRRLCRKLDGRLDGYIYPFHPVNPYPNSPDPTSYNSTPSQISYIYQRLEFDYTCFIFYTSRSLFLCLTYKGNYFTAIGGGVQRAPTQTRICATPSHSIDTPGDNMLRLTPACRDPGLGGQTWRPIHATTLKV